MYRTFSCKKKKKKITVTILSNPRRECIFNFKCKFQFELCNYSISLLPSVVNTCTEIIVMDFFQINDKLTVWRPNKMIYIFYCIYDFNILSKSRHPNFCIIFMSVDRQKQNTCTNIKKTFWFLFGQNRDINNITKQ